MYTLPQRLGQGWVVEHLPTLWRSRSVVRQQVLPRARPCFKQLDRLLLPHLGSNRADRKALLCKPDGRSDHLSKREASEASVNIIPHHGCARNRLLGDG